MISEGSGYWRRVGSRSWRMRRAITSVKQRTKETQKQTECSRRDILLPSLTVRSSGGLPPCCAPGPPRPSDCGGNVALNQTLGRLRECASGSVVCGCEEEGGVVVVVLVVVAVEGEGGLSARSRVRRGGCETAVAAAVLDRCRRIADADRDTAETELKDVVIVRLDRVVRR
jgi:hypothetical protein